MSQTINVNDVKTAQTTNDAAKKRDAQIAQIKAMNLDQATERKLLKALGVEVTKQTFERFDYVVDNPKSKQHGLTIPMIALNPVRGQAKSITLWQAKLLVDNFDDFILFYEELKEQLQSEGFDIEAMTNKS